MEIDDTELLKQVEFEKPRLADIFHSEYARLSNQAVSLGMKEDALSNRSRQAVVSKVWCKATGQDAEWCRMPEFSQLENPGTAANYLEAGYSPSDVSRINRVEVQQIRISSAEEPNWRVTLWQRFFADVADDDFELSYQDINNWELLSIPGSTRRYKVDKAVIELPADTLDVNERLSSLASSPDEFQRLLVAQIKDLSVRVRTHIGQTYAGEQAEQLQQSADTRFKRLEELVQLHRAEFHQLLVDVRTPAQ